ncbi:ATP-dependent helicase dcl2 [Penicillium frequentans]|uniref:ATP-dependent helicase dcl2 n=1 Tax=Penicillium frequentans TaxID=3151616 RepID=A0AAD6D655_9EURO|nr:ATP-dependent helicase dcl2 [Penicillium glabrum]
MRMLTGDDGVDCWSNQDIWDTALGGMRVVFSTHAVLADALAHGFVSLQQLALLVFDEAHHCMKSHPGNRIMRDFYHQAKRENTYIPSILGLTASVDVAKIRELENNLDAVCRAPLAQHQELAEYGPERDFTNIVYSKNSGDTVKLPLCLQKLETIIMELRENGKAEGYSIPDDISKLPMKARAICCDLGAWALQYFLTKNFQLVARHVAKQEAIPSVQSPGHIYTALVTALGQILESPVVQLDDPGSICNKVEQLLAFLKLRDQEGFSAARNSFRCAPCVSSSANSESWAKDEFQEGEEVVLQFRSGLKNLIIATSVLEEGIDLPACHLAISYEVPDNITSFIQRRGRARTKICEFAVMTELDSESESMNSKRWKDLERQMESICLNHQRSHREMDERQSVINSLQLRTHAGALLTSEIAIPHLYHFCTTLRSGTTGKVHPTFSFEINMKGLHRSTVYPPSGVDTSLRIAKGHHWWATKQLAQQDAAFQAVHALYNGNLINDHFLPLFPKSAWGGDERHQAEPLAQLFQTEDFLKFWKNIPGHGMDGRLYRYRVGFAENGTDRPEISMALYTSVQMPLPLNEDIDLHWDDQTTLTVSLQSVDIETSITPSASERCVMRTIATLLFESTRAASSQECYPDCLPFFTPDIPVEELEDWLSVHQGSVTIRSGQSKIPILCPSGLVRSPGLHFVPHLFLRWSQDPYSKELFIESRRFSKRRNLLQRASLSHGNSYGTKLFTKTRVAAAECTIDHLPWELSLASLAIPPLIQLLHRHLMVNEIRTGILKGLPGITSNRLAEAITAPCSQWPINYQRLEFLGDSILKLSVSTHCFYRYPLWHEGYLSKFKDLLVSNRRRTQAAVDAHLGRFICTDFITRKHPVFAPFGDGFQIKELPRKIFADVIESLIGAVYISGGLSLSQKLLGIFFPEVADLLTAPQRTQKQFSCHLDPKLDILLDYKFKDRNLIWEALTHPSWQRDNTTGSYQRLELLGDAVLDFVVSKNLYNMRLRLSEGRMTQLRAALVNADFLAFLCMAFALTEPHYPTSNSTSDACEQAAKLQITPLWTFMRHDASDIVRAQASCSERFRVNGSTIRKSLEKDRSYPWAKLAELRPSKFYSDIIESTMGAIFVDSGGCIDSCERFLKRIKLIAYLERFMRERVLLDHPKEVFDRIFGTQKRDFQVEKTADGLYNVSVWVEGEEITTIDNCSTKNEAVVRGANAAIALLFRG